nr:uncharacterized protein LOC127339518 [Lolium perenne]
MGQEASLTLEDDGVVVEVSDEDADEVADEDADELADEDADVEEQGSRRFAPGANDDEASRSRRPLPALRAGGNRGGLHTGEAARGGAALPPPAPLLLQPKPESSEEDPDLRVAPLISAAEEEAQWPQLQAVIRTSVMEEEARQAVEDAEARELFARARREVEETRRHEEARLRREEQRRREAERRAEQGRAPAGRAPRPAEREIQMDGALELSVRSGSSS